MLKYLYNPDFLDFDWSLKDYAHASWLILLLIILLLRRFRRTEHRRILYFVLYSLFMEYIAGDDDVKELFGDVGTSPIYHILTPGLFFFMSYLFADMIYKGKRRLFGICLLIGFLIVSVGNMAWVGLSNFPTIPVGLYSLTGISLAIGYFLNLLNKVEIEYLEKEPMFWISTGVLIYFSGNFLVWIGYNFLNYDVDFFYSIYRINTFSTMLLHCFFLIALFIDPKPVDTKAIN